MKNQLSILCLSGLLWSCSAAKQNCQQVVEERYASKEGFEITEIKTYKAKGLKLAMGPYREETRKVVQIRFKTAEKEDHCTCLMRGNGSFITTTDDIKYK